MSVLINCFYCPMKNSRKLDSPKRSIIDKKKKRLVNPDSHDNENSDVLVSAVISPYLLTHLHHILQQSEYYCLLYTSPSPRDSVVSRMPSSA